MSIVKVNKSGLGTIAGDLKSKVSSLDSDIEAVAGTLESIPAHEDFPSLTSKASMIANSLKNLSTDYKYLGDNIQNYVDALVEIDGEGCDSSAEALKAFNSANTKLNISPNTGTTKFSHNANSSKGNYTYSYSTGPRGVKTNNGFSNNNEVGTLVYTGSVGTLSSIVGSVSKDELIEMGQIIETEEGTVIEVPVGLGSVHTYMGWQMITARDSQQYKLIESAGMNFDEEGFGMIGDRYVIACTETYGKVGDYIDVYKEDGTVLKCIIGDIKNQSDPGCNVWGHENGENIIEFVVDKNTWYNGNRGGHANPGTEDCHPEWNQNIVKIVNKGNYFDILNDRESDKVIMV